jgi:hypothetical protein
MSKDDTSVVGGCLLGMMTITSVFLSVVLPWFGVVVSRWVFYADVAFFAVLGFLLVGLPTLLAKQDEPPKQNDDGSQLGKGQHGEKSGAPVNSSSQAVAENDQAGGDARAAPGNASGRRSCWPAAERRGRGHGEQAEGQAAERLS